MDTNAAKNVAIDYLQRVRQAVIRAWNVCIKPDSSWREIAASPEGMREIYRVFLIPLAVLCVLFSWVSSLTLGAGFIRSLLHALVMSGGAYLLAPYIAGRIGAIIGPKLAGPGDALVYFKVAAFGSSAAVLAMVFLILPSILPILALLGLYSIYLVYAGARILIVTEPAGNWVKLFVAWILSVAIVMIVLSMIVSPILFAVGITNLPPALYDLQNLDEFRKLMGK